VQIISATHIRAQAYSIQLLTVTDAHSNTITVTCPVITVNPNVSSDLATSCSASPTVGLGAFASSIYFTDYRRKSPIQLTAGTFGDLQSSSSTANYISHTYENSGTFMPVLTVRDSNGRSSICIMPTD